MEEQKQIRADQHYLPIRVNDPMIVVAVDVDEVRPIVIAFALGVPFDAINYLLPLSLVFFVLSRKLKAKYARGIISHIGWWHGILPMKSSCSMPDPLKRELYR